MSTDTLIPCRDLTTFHHTYVWLIAFQMIPHHVNRHRNVNSIHTKCICKTKTPLDLSLDFAYGILYSCLCINQYKIINKIRWSSCSEQFSNLTKCCRKSSRMINMRQSITPMRVAMAKKAQTVPLISIFERPQQAASDTARTQSIDVHPNEIVQQSPPQMLTNSN